MVSGTLSGRAYEHIQRRIVSGELAAGAVISEHSLAREMGVSRTPVREAIQRLEREGLVEQVPRYGTIVRRPERRDVVELFELREAMECFAVGRAAQAVTDADVAMLGRLCEEIAELAHKLQDSGQRCLGAAGMKRFLAADMAFHMVLIRAAGNRRIMRAVAESRVLGRIFATPRQDHDLAVLRQTHRYHAAITQAVKRRSAESAQRLMRDHLHASLRAALEHFDHAEAVAPGDGRLDLPADLLGELEHLEQSKSAPRRRTATRRKATTTTR